MKIDIEAILAAKREEREAEHRRIEDSQRERRERRIQRAQEDEERYEKKLREHFEFVAQCFTEYSPVRLHTWFLLDNWDVKDGLILLSGFDPKWVPLDEEGEVSIPVDKVERHLDHKFKFIRRLDNLDPFGYLTEEILDEPFIKMLHWDFKLLHSRIVRIWNSGTHTETRYPPKYFIDWAISKRFDIEWLEWARAQGYYGEALSESSNKEVSPKSEAAFLNIIGALCELYWGAAHDGQDYSQSVLLDELKKYEGFPGMSERNLKDKLTKAMRAMKS